MLKGKGLLSAGQRRFLRLFSKTPDSTHFYLTGGTALAEFYLGHRYSFDLDLFRGEPRGARGFGSPCLQLVRVHSLGSLWTGSARFSALSPSPSPTLWERGESSADMFGVLKRQLQHQAEAPLPHSIIPLSRGAGEGDTA